LPGILQFACPLPLAGPAFYIAEFFMEFSSSARPAPFVVQHNLRQILWLFLFMTRQHHFGSPKNFLTPEK
jgi:hypothetical protein